MTLNIMAFCKNDIKHNEILHDDFLCIDILNNDFLHKNIMPRDILHHDSLNNNTQPKNKKYVTRCCNFVDYAKC